MKNERTYPELAGDRGRVRLVVLLAEVGGKWSGETANFVSALSKAKGQSRDSPCGIEVPNPRGLVTLAQLVGTHGEGVCHVAGETMLPNRVQRCAA